MTKSIEHKEQKETKAAVRGLQAVAGVLISLIIGICIILAAFLVGGGVNLSPTTTLPVLTFCIVGTALTYVGFRMTGARKNYGFRAARIVFIVGLSGIGLISLLTFAYMAFLNIEADRQASCSTAISDRVQSVLSATVPIGTDLGTGTGFYVTEDGKIITADHVVDGAKEIYINYATGKVPLRIIDRAPDYDLALLATVEPSENIFPLNLSESYSPGQEVVAAGYPGNSLFAGQASVTKGIVSRVISPEDLKLNEITAPTNLEFVQTDSAVNPGNSGGALVGLCGVIGVVSAKSDRSNLREYGISSEEGISFAVSSKSVASRFSLPIK